MSRALVLARSRPRYVGLLGALEMRLGPRPLLADPDDFGRTTMREMTESPRTENVCGTQACRSRFGCEA